MQLFFMMIYNQFGVTLGVKQSLLVRESHCCIFYQPSLQQRRQIFLAWEVPELQIAGGWESDLGHSAMRLPSSPLLQPAAGGYCWGEDTGSQVCLCWSNFSVPFLYVPSKFKGGRKQSHAGSSIVLCQQQLGASCQCICTIPNAANHCSSREAGRHLYITCGRLYSTAQGSYSCMSHSPSKLVFQSGHRTGFTGLSGQVSFPEAGDDCCTFAARSVISLLQVLLQLRQTEGTEMDFYELSGNMVLGWQFSTSVVVNGGTEVLLVINIATLL